MEQRVSDERARKIVEGEVDVYPGRTEQDLAYDLILARAEIARLRKAEAAAYAKGFEDALKAAADLTGSRWWITAPSLMEAILGLRPQPAEKAPERK